MMRRRIIDRIGPLDEHMYIEDVDLCYRILQDGWKIRYLTTAEIVHYDGASRKGSRKFYHHYQIAWTGLWYFFKKHKGPVQAMSFRLMTAIFSLLGVLLFSGGALFSLFTGKRSDSFADKLQKSKAVFLWSITPAACLKSDY
jgi:GT2 family glycosyltransferase